MGSHSPATMNASPKNALTDSSVKKEEVVGKPEGKLSRYRSNATSPTRLTPNLRAPRLSRLDIVTPQIRIADMDKPDTAVPSIKQPEEKDSGSKEENNNQTAPLAPPPKPSQHNDQDYFSNSHGSVHLGREPNPFESAFGTGSSAETPGKSQLPGIATLTSPASLLPGNTPGWGSNSLRSGPLSPAMLTGPTGTSDYFSGDHHFSGSFPTPNESSLRTGLTPGGGGSMFPQPSPNSQALFNQLQSGGATPGTIDFHRTAMTARAHSQAGNYNLEQNGQTSQPQQNPNIQPDLDSKPYASNTSQPQQQQQQQQQQENQQDPFSSHQTNDAANGLFMLAQAGGQQQQQRNGQQQGYGMQQQQQQYQQNMQQQQQQHEDMNNRGPKNSIGSTMSGSTENGQGDYSDDGMDVKPAARGGRGGKKGSAGKGAANGKRKNEETPSRAQNNKRQRGANGQSLQGSEEPEDMQSPEMEENGPDGRKMTDEEKRKNFLERNRVAALKCRQRKKQWLANLQQKVEIFSTENDALAATVTQLREEIVGLKTLLLAHKDCPVSVQQGISGMAMQQIAGQDHYSTHPYGMGLPGGPGSMQQNQMQQGGMQRR